MRTLTLAEAVQGAGMEAILLTRALPAPLRSRAASLGIEVIERHHDLTDPDAVAEVSASRCDLAVVDSYDASSDFMDALTSALAVAVIDDERRSALGAPVAVLNQNLHADRSTYQDLRPAVRLMLGPWWALVRPEIRAMHATSQRRQGTVFIALGGADVRRLTDTITEACASRGATPIVAAGLVSGQMSAAGDPGRFAEALATSEVAVVGAGTTILECLCVGTPAIAVVTADNQATIAATGVEAGLVHAAFDVRRTRPVDAIADEVAELSSNTERRRMLSEVGPSAVDGRGAGRVADVLREVLS